MQDLPHPVDATTAADAHGKRPQGSKRDDDPIFTAECIAQGPQVNLLHENESRPLSSRRSPP